MEVGGLQGLRGLGFEGFMARYVNGVPGVGRGSAANGSGEMQMSIEGGAYVGWHAAHTNSYSFMMCEF